MSPDGLSRGVPVQDLPENQDPSVRYTVDEVTGIVTHWEELEKPAPKKKAAKKSASPAAHGEEPADDAESGSAGAEKAADITSLRELGSQ